MLKTIHFTVPGLVFFEKAMRSCPPKTSNGGRESKEKFFQFAKQAKEIGLVELMERSGVVGWENTTFGHFYNDLRKNKINVVTEMTVAGYFGGPAHISNINEKIERGQIENLNGVAKSYIDHVLFVHTLISATVREVLENGYSAEYENGGITVVLNNLLSLSDAAPIKVGQKVWTHLGSIISGSVDPEIERRLQLLQGSNLKFKQICDSLHMSNVDVAELHYYAWARVASKLFS